LLLAPASKCAIFSFDFEAAKQPASAEVVSPGMITKSGLYFVKRASNFVIIFDIC